MGPEDTDNWPEDGRDEVVEPPDIDSDWIPPSEREPVKEDEESEK